MISKHSNWKYENSIPFFVGDRIYGQDMIRNFYSIISHIGTAIEGSVGQESFLLKGGIVSQGSSVNQIDITELFAIVKSNVEIPDSFATIPPSKTSINISVPIYLAAQSDISLSSATLDGSTINYVKAAYSVIDGNTRQRAKKPGTYSYEVQPTTIITINSVAPTQYELQLATLVGDDSTFLTITTTEYTTQISRIETNLLKTDLINEKNVGNGITVDGVLLKDKTVEAVGAASCGVYSCVSGNTGVYGKALSCGIFGCATGNIGIYGCAMGNYGTYGKAEHYGVVGCAMGNVGVYGRALSCGIFGCATGNCGVVGCASVNCGVVGCAAHSGVYGQAICCGIYGCATGNIGIYGCATGNIGVYGRALSCGILGCATGNCGVVGKAACYGIHGVAAISYPVSGNGAYYNTSSKFDKVNQRSICITNCLKKNPLPQYRWQWERVTGSTVENITPMAQDIQKTFDLDENNDGYTTLDGIALFGVQENLREIEKLKLHIKFLEEKINGYTAITN